MKSCGLKNERDRKQRHAPPAGCGPFAAVSGGASRWAAPMKYSGGRRGRAAAPSSAGAAGRSPLEGGGPVRSGAERCGDPSPSGRRALGEPRSLETSPGGAGKAGTWQHGGEEGLGVQGRGGHGAARQPHGCGGRENPFWGGGWRLRQRDLSLLQVFVRV